MSNTSFRNICVCENSAKWVPRKLKIVKKPATAKSKSGKKQQSTGKVMASIFRNDHGVILVEFLVG